MSATLERLKADLESVQTRAASILESDERTDASEANLQALLAEGEQLRARVQEWAQFDQLSAGASTLDRIVGGANKRREEAVVGETAGETFTRSEVFRSYRGHGTSPTIEVRALPMSIGSIGGSLPKTTYSVTPPDPAGPLLGLISTVSVSTNSIDVVTWAKVSGGAEVVPEGQQKPPVEWAPTSSPVVLDTIAAYTEATRQLLEDASAVRSLIDQGLAREVTRKQESEAGAAIAAATLPTATGADLLSAIRIGMGTVQEAGYEATAVLLNPSDWAALDITLLSMTTNGPVLGRQFWGLTPVASSAQPAGTATVGDFAAGIQRFVRTGVSIYITDSHSTNFTKNIFTILGESRAKTVVTRPAALVECTAAVTP